MARKQEDPKEVLDKLYVISEEKEGRRISVLRKHPPEFFSDASPESILSCFGIENPTQEQESLAVYLAMCVKSASEAYVAAVTPDYQVASNLVARFAADNKVTKRRYILSSYVRLEDLMNVKFGEVKPVS